MLPSDAARPAALRETLQTLPFPRLERRSLAHAGSAAANDFADFVAHRDGTTLVRPVATALAVTVACFLEGGMGRSGDRRGRSSTESGDHTDLERDSPPGQYLYVRAASSSPPLDRMHCQLARRTPAGGNKQQQIRPQVVDLLPAAKVCARTNAALPMRH
jgi:hypothetical protein